LLLQLLQPLLSASALAISRPCYKSIIAIVCIYLFIIILQSNIENNHIRKQHEKSGIKTHKFKTTEQQI